MAWREAVAANPPPRHRGETYWGRPVPGFGDPNARLLIVGLAPAAHGGNRTGRIFTGDSSGDTLFGALFRAGFANQALSISLEDGLHLTDCYITASARCAPPDNRPTPAEFETCRPYLVRELAALAKVKVILALGALGWEQVLSVLQPKAATPPRRARPAFAHGAEVDLPGGRSLVGCYHVSRQNTNTGRLTSGMLDAIFRRVRELL